MTAAAAPLPSRRPSGTDEDATKDYCQRQRHGGCWDSKFRSKAPDTPWLGSGHNYAPTKLDLEAHSWDCDNVTTLMIRNVPTRYDRALLMQELDELGLADTYDFIYVPADSTTGWTLGHALVNFERPAQAQLCLGVMQGHYFLRFRQGKPHVAEVTAARIQGLENNLRYCSSTSVFNASQPDHGPWVREQQEELARHAKPPANTLECEVRSEHPCAGRRKELQLLELPAPDAHSQGSDTFSTADSSCMGSFLPGAHETWADGSTPTPQWRSESIPCATSLTLLNVPPHYTEDMLKWTLESMGLLFRCDFVYLPRVRAVGDAMTWNMGHALLNFLTPDDAALARTHLDGHVWDSRVRHEGKQIVAEVEDAMPQDYQACVKYFNMLTYEQTSCKSMVDWLDVPALNPGSPAWQDY